MIAASNIKKSAAVATDASFSEIPPNHPSYYTISIHPIFFLMLILPRPVKCPNDPYLFPIIHTGPINEYQKHPRHTSQIKWFSRTCDKWRFMKWWWRNSNRQKGNMELRNFKWIYAKSMHASHLAPPRSYPVFWYPSPAKMQPARKEKITQKKRFKMYTTSHSLGDKRNEKRNRSFWSQTKENRMWLCAMKWIRKR